MQNAAETGEEAFPQVPAFWEATPIVQVPQAITASGPKSVLTPPQSTTLNILHACNDNVAFDPRFVGPLSIPTA